MNIVGTNGTFTSPNYPSNYTNNANCSWRITVPDGFVVRLTFNVFKLEGGSNCRYDYVEIRDSTGSVMGKYCGSNGPFVVMSTGSSLYIRFKSDGTVKKKGFSASFSAIIRPTNPPPGKTIL